ncbi:MAG: ParB/RepB/Spo0J family partition protein, partial [Christensenellaceae bacterium]|nr:ParB/RepB/Spo0J family partition protein [Christensenellaceae bacterium]
MPVRDDEEMMSLVESIATFGVITPVIARKTADERYELISGHRRKRACELLHIDTLPIIVRDLSREEGIILMVDSNLQREHILPSEKAFAYKMKMEAMKCQGKRNDLTSPPLVEKLNDRDKWTSTLIGNEHGESQEQVRRYIRLTELIPQLL